MAAMDEISRPDTGTAMDEKTGKPKRKSRYLSTAELRALMAQQKEAQQTASGGGGQLKTQADTDREDMMKKMGVNADDMNSAADDVMSRLKAGKRPFLDRANARYGGGGD